MEDSVTEVRFRTGRQSFLFVFIFMAASLSACAIQIPSLKLNRIERLVIQDIYASENEITITANRHFSYRLQARKNRPELVVFLKETYPGRYRQPIPMNNGVVTAIIPRRIVDIRGVRGTELRIVLKHFMDFQVKENANKLIITLQNKHSNLSKVGFKIDEVGDELRAKELSSGTEPLNNEIGDYVIGPEDVLEIIVWKNAELSKVVTVRPDGRISLPLIGDIQASDVTADALRESIKEQLKKFQKFPEVSVIVQQVNSFSVFIMGEVARPGKLQLRSDTTLLQALTLSGGFTQFAAIKKIILFRRENGREQRIKINYDDIVTGKNPRGNILLKRGDTIVVP